MKAATGQTEEPARGERPEVRFLARAEGYEIVLPGTPPAEPLVRLRFEGGQVEVMLTLAEVAAFCTALQRLQAYLQHERLTALTNNDLGGEVMFARAIRPTNEFGPVGGDVI